MGYYLAAWEYVIMLEHSFTMEGDSVSGLKTSGSGFLMETTDHAQGN